MESLELDIKIKNRSLKCQPISEKKINIIFTFFERKNEKGFIRARRS